MSDIIIEDIDGNFVELNDKVDGAQSYADVCDYVVLWLGESVYLFTHTEQYNE